MSVYRRFARVDTTYEATHDNSLFFNYNKKCHIVGAQVMVAHQVTPECWAEHPDRSEVPADLLAKLDEVALANGLGQTGAHEGVW